MLRLGVGKRLRQAYVLHTADTDGIAATVSNRLTTLLAQVRKQPGQGLRIPDFTAGCPISVAVQSFLGPSTRAALDIDRLTRDALLTHYLY